MPHVQPLADAQAPETARNLFQSLQSKLGMVPNIFRTMGHAPEVLQATLGLDQAIHKNLEPKLRELAYLKTSELNNCQYWLHYHRALGRKAGLTDAQIQELGRYEQSSAYNDMEKVAIRFAEQWTRQGKVSGDLMQRLAKTLSPAQLIVLAATVALANWTNRFNESFGIELP